MACNAKETQRAQKSKCDDECLRRIAARLCRLGDCNEFDVPRENDNCDKTSEKPAVTSCGTGREIDCCSSAVRTRSNVDLEKDATTAVAEQNIPACSSSTLDKKSATCCASKPKENTDTYCSSETQNDNIFCCSFQPKQSYQGVDSDVKSCDAPPVGCTGVADNAHGCCDSIEAKTCCGSDELWIATDCCDSKTKTSDCSSLPPKVNGCGTQTKCCSGDADGMIDTSTTSVEMNRTGAQSDDDCECCDSEVEDPEEKTNVSDCVDDCCKLLSTRGTAKSESACDSHLQAAFKRFEALLAHGRCLCRSVFDELGFCCCSLGPKGVPTVSKACNTHSVLSEKTGKVVADIRSCRDTEIHNRCEYEPARVTEVLKSSVDAIETQDVEHTAARERVVLNVSGMTCTGCSRKMMNVMKHVPAISNAQVTFVSGMADFDFDGSTAEIEDVLAQLEKETGFKCQRISSGYQNLDVVMLDASAQKLTEEHASVSVAKGRKGTYTITYDPRSIGARSIINGERTLAPPTDDAGVNESKRRLWNMLCSFVAAAVFTIPVVVLNWSNNPLPYLTKMTVSLVLATVVQLIAVPEFYIGALKSLIYSRVIEMDMLVVISITAAYIYSIVAFGLTLAGYELVEGAFFETGSLLITLVLFGRLMAAWARMRAISAVSLRSLQVETALLLEKDGNSTKIDARLLQFDDGFKVLPHSLIVTDGTIVFGDSAVDESILTGESTPVAKSVGDKVIGGTMNGHGVLHVRLSRLPGENSITDIAKLVENAVSAKPKVQDLADKVASWFIPSVMAIALIVFVIWIAVGIEVRDMSGGGAVGVAITYAIAVLAISCPCALGLAVPMVLVIAGGLAARKGVIIKAANATERGHKVTDVVFDKTGTLTKGDLQVVHEETIVGQVASTAALAITKILVNGNSHPISAAVASHLADRSTSTVEMKNLQSIPGAGIQAKWDDKTVMAGNPYWLGLENHSSIVELPSQGMTIFCVSVDGELVVAFGLKSTLRDEAPSVINNLQQRSITCHIVSGDGTRVVEDVARKLSIAPEHTVSRSSPAGKQAYIHRLQQPGKVVLFCGDGTNDAVAVAQANVGVQIGSASDVTASVADVVLLGGLEGVITLLDISRRSFNRICFNFVWAAVYNFFAILLASGAFVEFRIPPAYAGLGEIVSVGPVILAAATLAIGNRRGGK